MHGSQASGATSRPRGRPPGRSSAPSGTASGRSSRWPTGARKTSGRTSWRTTFRTTPSTMRATARSGACPARGRRGPTRRSGPAAGPGPTSWNVAFISEKKGTHDGTHLRPRAPGVGRDARRRFLPLVHGSLRLGQDDDRAPRRPRARPARRDRRVPRRRHGAHAPLQGPRVLQGGPRHEHRAHRLGRLAARPPRRRRHLRRHLSLRGDEAQGARHGARSRARSSRSSSAPPSRSARAAT